MMSRRHRHSSPEAPSQEQCEICSTPYFVAPEDEGRFHTCSRKCEREYQRLKRSTALEERKRSLDGLDPVTPDKSARLRSRIFDCVTEQMEHAHKFVIDAPGARPLNAQQVAIFRSLLNKVVPDLSHTFSERASDSRPLEDLSREELEAIVAAGRDAATKTIDTHPTDVEDATITHPSETPE